MLQRALHGDDRTAGNTTTTVQQAMSLFFQDDIRRRRVPGAADPRRARHVKHPGTTVGSIDARSRLSFIQRVNATSGTNKKSPDVASADCTEHGVWTPLRVSLN